MDYLDPGMQGTPLQLKQDRALEKQGYWFDKAAADHFCEFSERYCRHSKGKWAGQPIILAPWQRKHLRRLFGWRRPNGTRRYRRAFWEVPRKNGKSTVLSVVMNYLTEADGEPGARVYSAANDKEQAKEVFDEAKNMVNASPELSTRTIVYKDSISVPTTNSVYRVLSGRTTGKHGLNVHGIGLDEVHEMKDRELYDTLTTAQGSRRQPLEFVITTSGYDRHSLCYELHDYAMKCIEGIIEDHEFLPVVYAAGEHDDWKSEETWKKANPNYGVSLDVEYFQSEFRKACQSPGRENAFKRLHLNIWTEQAKRWLDIEDWKGCRSRVLDLADLAGRECYAGLDLSKTTDLSALVMLFPWTPDEELEFGGPGYHIVPRFWVPEESADKRSKRDRVPYPTWIKQGYITATPGNVVDYRYIRKDIVEISQQVQLLEIAYDRWSATELVQNLQDDDGLTMVQFGQGFVSMAAPTAELERLVTARRINHMAHPVLRWMASHVVVSQNPAGDIKPDKAKSRERIDGIVALVMALGRASVRASGISVYESRGVTTFGGDDDSENGGDEGHDG